MTRGAVSLTVLLALGMSGMAMTDSGPRCQTDCCKRVTRPGGSAEGAANLTSLAQDLSPLAEAFNAAKQRPRFLALLSPTCSACVHGAEAIQAAVLPAKDKVEVLVVWTPMLDSDGAAEASASSAVLAAPGVRQFWDPQRRAGAALRKDAFPDAVEKMRRSLPKDHFFAPYLAERDKSQPEWDMYLLFGPGVDWTDRAPNPTRWIRQTARFAKGGHDELTSLLWIDDYANPPIEGSLAEHLKRLVSASPVGAPPK